MQQESYHIGFPMESCYTTRAGNLKKHFDAFHESFKPYECKRRYCSATLATSLKNHIDTNHEGSKPYQCNLCSSSATQAGSLQNHVDIIHKEVFVSVVYVPQH